jgi:DNA-binding FadR family transcriptional regulator
MAEVVADRLRTAILNGEIDVVPRLEDLVAEYEVGPPAAREAMRILDTEGLITVRRGNVGGADVHMPTSDRVAYMLSLVLQSERTRLADVGDALRQLEPVCASLCAARSDRHLTLVPRLRDLLAEQADAIGDGPRTMRITDEFHHTIVGECGNVTLVQVVGALERIWAAHAEAVYEGLDASSVDPKVWRASLREHEKIVDAIDRGDPKVAEYARRHLEATHAYMSATDDRRMVTASIVRHWL